MTSRGQKMWNAKVTADVERVFIKGRSRSGFSGLKMLKLQTSALSLQYISCIKVLKTYMYVSTQVGMYVVAEIKF